MLSTEIDLLAVGKTVLFGQCKCATAVYLVASLAYKPGNDRRHWQKQSATSAHKSYLVVQLMWTPRLGLRRARHFTLTGHDGRRRQVKSSPVLPRTVTCTTPPGTRLATVIDDKSVYADPDANPAPPPGVCGPHARRVSRLASEQERATWQLTRVYALL